MDKEKKFKELLKKIFQYDKDKIDLDFGVYRVFKHKQKEIENYIEEELPRFIQDNLNGIDDVMPVYSHALEFFGRYFQDGDFYPVPIYSTKKKHILKHNGEEVVFSWANKDQYYIKSIENFSIYRIKKENLYNDALYQTNTQAVNFVVDEIEDTKGNNKTARLFILSEKKAEFVKDEGFNIYLDYKFKKKDTKEVDTTILEKIILEDAKINLSKEEIEHHLKKFKNLRKRDFFIHKKLEAFLKEELDYYLKTDVLKDLEHLSDIDIKTAQTVKKVSEYIIKFIASLEELQKILWEKKKFAYDTNYIITLDKIKKETLEKIVEDANFKKQLDEWIDDLKLISELNKEQMFDKDELRSEYKYLPLDTKHFDEMLKYEILEQFENLDEEIDGILINSDNFHGLNFLQNRFKEQIKCVYIDPPYNTEEDRKNGSFAYKDDYAHSSWISLINSRLEVLEPMMKKESVVFTSIDDNEMLNLVSLYKLMGYGYVQTLPTIMNLKGNNDEFGFAGAHEYTIASIKNGVVDNALFELDVIEDGIEQWEVDEIGFYKKGANLKSSGENAPREKRPNLYFPLLYKDGVVTTIKSDEYEKIYNKEKEQFDDDFVQSLKKKYEKDGFVFVLPMDEKKKKLSWRWSYEKMLKEPYDIVPSETKKSTTFYKKQRPELKDFPTKKQKSILYKPSYSSGNGTAELKSLFGDKPFKAPKPLNLINDLIQIGTNDEGIVLDFFLGSGTTIHSIIEKKKLSKSNKFLGIESGEYFQSIVLKRAKKAIYATAWKDGMPLDVNGCSEIIKYYALEQYEDTLENSKLQASQDDIEAYICDLKSLKEQMRDLYTSKYLSLYRDFVSRESKSLLMDDSLFFSPFDFKLKININGQVVEKNIDIVETFNTLKGIRVKNIKLRKFDNKRYVFVDGENEVIIWREFEKESLDREQELQFINDNCDSSKQLYLNGVTQTYSQKQFSAIESVFEFRALLVEGVTDNE